MKLHQCCVCKEWRTNRPETLCVYCQREEMAAANARLRSNPGIWAFDRLTDELAKMVADKLLGHNLADELKTDILRIDMSNVNHPAHYNSGKIEVIEAIEDWGLSKNYHRASVIKYAARAGKKDPSKEIEDLEKARWYLDREIELLKAQQEGRNPRRPNDMNPRDETKILVARGSGVEHLQRDVMPDKVKASNLNSHIDELFPKGTK